MELVEPFKDAHSHSSPSCSRSNWRLPVDLALLVALVALAVAFLALAIGFFALALAIAFLAITFLGSAMRSTIAALGGAAAHAAL